jgi:hypothetical protein
MTRQSDHRNLVDAALLGGNLTKENVYGKLK